MQRYGTSLAGQACSQCCHSVMKKNPRIYLEKTPENKKNSDIQNVVKTKLEMYASGTCT